MRYIRIHVNPKNNLHQIFLVQLIQRLLQLLKTCNTNFNSSLKPRDIFLYKNLDFRFSAGFFNGTIVNHFHPTVIDRRFTIDIYKAISYIRYSFINKALRRSYGLIEKNIHSSRKEQWRIRKNIVLSNSTIAARIVIVQPINMNIVILFSIRHLYIDNMQTQKKALQFQRTYKISSLSSNPKI